MHGALGLVGWCWCMGVRVVGFVVGSIPTHGYTTNSRAVSSVRSSTTSVGPTQGAIPEEGG